MVCQTVEDGIFSQLPLECVQSTKGIEKKKKKKREKKRKGEQEHGMRIHSVSFVSTSILGVQLLN